MVKVWNGKNINDCDKEIDRKWSFQNGINQSYLAI